MKQLLREARTEEFTGTGYGGTRRATNEHMTHSVNEGQAGHTVRETDGGARTDLQAICVTMGNESPRRNIGTTLSDRDRFEVPRAPSRGQRNGIT